MVRVAVPPIGRATTELCISTSSSSTRGETYVTDRCPDDPNNIKCCTIAGCPEAAATADGPVELVVELLNRTIFSFFPSPLSRGTKEKRLPKITPVAQSVLTLHCRIMSWWQQLQML